jgi:glycerol-3-phosphate dehydrogenase
MAEDTVDTVVRRTGMSAGPCRTTRLPLDGAAPRDRLARLMVTSASPRLVRRYGVDAARVLATARAVTGLGDDDLLRPVAPGVAVTLAELVFGVTDEGAHDVDDLLERRTRVGMVPADRALCEPAAASALELARSANVK